VLAWLSRRKKGPGWLAFTIDEQAVSYVIGHNAGRGKAQIARYGRHAVQGGGPHPEKFARELHADRHQCSTLLRPGEYQMLLVEAPSVPQNELKSAIRWRIKDMIDYHVDDAALDVLDIPAEESPAGARSHSMYAIAARNDVIQSCIERSESLRVPLSVIEIPETAQRNIASLFEMEGDARGIALLHLDERSSLLTVNCRGELFLARRFEIGLEHLRGARDDATDRILLELRRTFDHFERQFRNASIGRLLLAPQPGRDSLAARFADELGLAVETADLGAVLAFDGNGTPDAETQWRLFHLFGAALRYEAKAL